MIMVSTSKVLIFTYSVLLFCIISVFLALRTPELLSLACVHSYVQVHLSIVILLMGSLIVLPPSTLGYLFRRFGVILMILLILKKRIDGSLQQSLKLVALDKVAVITGANSGIGFAITKHLIKLGATVVMACRNEVKCTAAASKIKKLHPHKRSNVISMQLDLSDLESVWNFSQSLQQKFDRVDILINNAGLMSGPGFLTKQGIEGLLGVMHVGHFALTEWLLPALQKPLSTLELSVLDPARIINVASAVAFLQGKFHSSLMQSQSGEGDLRGEITDNCGVVALPFSKSISCCPMFACPHTNGYARAKLANVLYILELQRRLDVDMALRTNLTMPGGGGGIVSSRRVVTASVHPGSVSTRIVTGFDWRVMSLALRSTEDAAYVILHAILDDSFLPGSFIDSQKRAHSLYPNLQAESARLRHLAAYNSMRLSHCAPLLPDHGSGDAVFSLPDWIWSRLKFITPAAQTNATADPVSYDSLAVAERLYNVTKQLIEDWKLSSSIISVQQLDLELDLEVEQPQGMTDNGDDDNNSDDGGNGGGDNPGTIEPLVTILIAEETPKSPISIVKGRLASIKTAMKRFAALIKQAVKYYISYGTFLFNKF